MIDAAILDGDWVAVRQQTTAENGETVVAMIDGEATVKTLRYADGRVWLMPQNPVYEPIPPRKARFLARWSAFYAASRRHFGPIIAPDFGRRPRASGTAIQQRHIAGCDHSVPDTTSYS